MTPGTEPGAALHVSDASGEVLPPPEATQPVKVGCATTACAGCGLGAGAITAVAATFGAIVVVGAAVVVAGATVVVTAGGAAVVAAVGCCTTTT